MNVLSSGSALKPGDALTSQNGRYRLELQSDGNLVLTGPDRARMGLGHPRRGRRDRRDAGRRQLRALHRRPRRGVDRGHHRPGAHLVLQDDRNVVILAADGTTVLWTPNCYVTEAERAAEEQAVADEQAQQAPAAPAPPGGHPRPADLHGPARRHALGDRQALLRPRGRVPAHRRGEQHREPGPDPPGPAAGHPGLTSTTRVPGVASQGPGSDAGTTPGLRLHVRLARHAVVPPSTVMVASVM